MINMILNHDHERTFYRFAIISKKLQDKYYKLMEAVNVCFNVGIPKVISSYDFDQYEQPRPVESPKIGNSNGWKHQYNDDVVKAAIQWRNAIANENLITSNPQNIVIHEERCFSFSKENTIKGFFAINTNDHVCTLPIGTATGLYPNRKYSGILHKNSISVDEEGLLVKEVYLSPNEVFLTHSNL
jgi:hypothetical protein